MKLLRVHLLNRSISINFRSKFKDVYAGFDPICLVGTNGVENLLLVRAIAEIFKIVSERCLEKQKASVFDFRFEIEYLIWPKKEPQPVHVWISNRDKLLVRRNEEGTWNQILDDLTLGDLIPTVVTYNAEQNTTEVSRLNIAEEFEIPLKKHLSIAKQERQIHQLLGTISQLAAPNTLFLLEEPTLFLSPKSQAGLMSDILQLSTSNTVDCLIATHSPFILPDFPQDHVFLLSSGNGRTEVHHPETETFGASFDRILESCFQFNPPTSQYALEKIRSLMNSNDSEEVKAGLKTLADSVQKAFLADHLRQISK